MHWTTQKRDLRGIIVTEARGSNPEDPVDLARDPGVVFAGGTQISLIILRCNKYSRICDDPAGAR